jgi:hypothetical protein
MSYVYLPEQVVDFSEANCLDLEPSAMSSERNTVLRSSRQGSGMAALTMPLSGMTLKHSTGNPGLDVWILSQRDSPASRSQSQGSGKEQMTTAICGPKPSGLFARYDRDSACWKTCLDFFQEGTVLGDLSESGYDARWRIVSAADVGAPHLRKRLWILAYSREF